MGAIASPVPPPSPVTPLIGREELAAESEALLTRPGVRVVTLVGAGGAGKTRLAIHLARSVHASFDRVAFVNLAGLASAAAVPGAIAESLGLREGTGRPAAERIALALEGTRSLLVLDNFEHLLAAAGTVSELISASERLTVLATSRSVLRVAGEHVVEVPPLALPPLGPMPPLAELEAIPAIRLFTERAQSASNDFSLSDDSAPAVVEICRRLDGLPLAIELAAARTRILPPVELLARLERRLPLLTAGGRDRPLRQQSLRDTIAWSYDLLAPPEQGLFRRLSLFPGGWTLETAEAISLVQPPDSAIDVLGSLLDQSLVIRTSSGAAAQRFGMLTTIREFALDQLDAAGERGSACENLLAWAIDLAERGRAALDGPDQHAWLARLELEHPNLRAALEWACEHRPAEAANLAGLLGRFWEVHAHIREGRGWLDRALATSNIPAATKARTLLPAAALARAAGDWDAARGHLELCLSLQSELSDREGAARAWYELAQVAHYEADFEGLHTACRESLALYRELDDRRGVAVAGGLLGHAAWHLHDFETARRLLGETIAVWRELGDDLSISWALWDFGNIARDQGDSAAARESYADGLRGARRAGDMQLIAALLSGVAALAVRERQPVRAARLLGATTKIRDVHGLAVALSFARDVHLPLVAAIEGALEPADYEEAKTAGYRLSLDEALNEALDSGTFAPAMAPVMAVEHTPGHGLSEREVEVLRVIAAGMTNRQIADDLVLSLNTVYRHVSNIFAKTGAANRTEAALWAHEHGLIHGKAH